MNYSLELVMGSNTNQTPGGREILGVTNGVKLTYECKQPKIAFPKLKTKYSVWRKVVKATDTKQEFTRGQDIWVCV